MTACNYLIAAGEKYPPMTVEQRSEVQQKFMANELRIVVATNAFGMGIDNNDIRNLVCC